VPDIGAAFRDPKGEWRSAAAIAAGWRGTRVRAAQTIRSSVSSFRIAW
jgi:hypothetical protein